MRLSFSITFVKRSFLFLPGRAKVALRESRILFWNYGEEQQKQKLNSSISRYCNDSSYSRARQCCFCRIEEKTTKTQRTQRRINSSLCPLCLCGFLILILRRRFSNGCCIYLYRRLYHHHHPGALL